MASVLLLTSCHKKSRLVGKWDLIDERVSCTNPVLDSLEKAKIGIYKSGELINKSEVENDVTQKTYFEFKSNSKYSHKSAQMLTSGSYEMKDSFLLTTMTVLDLDYVVGGYKVHFIDENNLQLTEEMTIKNNNHIHTYTFFFKKRSK